MSTEFATSLVRHDASNRHDSRQHHPYPLALAVPQFSRRGHTPWGFFFDAQLDEAPLERRLLLTFGTHVGSARKNTDGRFEFESIRTCRARKRGSVQESVDQGTVETPELHRSITSSATNVDEGRAVEETCKFVRILRRRRIWEGETALRTGSGRLADKLFEEVSHGHRPNELLTHRIPCPRTVAS
jgi:hypothetical protein